MSDNITLPGTGSKTETKQQTNGEHRQVVTDKVTVVSANFTRVADTNAYASGDQVAQSTTAGSCSPLSFNAASVIDGIFEVRRARLKISGVVITNAQFRIHLYRSSPTIAGGDNAAWSTTESGYLGAIDVTVTQAFTDGAKGIGAPNAGTQIIAQPTSGALTIFGLIEARAAFTPTSAEVFTVELELIQH